MKQRLELYGWLFFLVGIVLWVIQTIFCDRAVRGKFGHLTIFNIRLGSS